MCPPDLESSTAASTQSHTGTHDEALPPSYQAFIHAKSALDLTSRIERKFAQYNASQNVFKRWLFEILSVTTSAICMGEEKPPINIPTPKLIGCRSNYRDTCYPQGSATWEMAFRTYYHNHTIKDRIGSAYFTNLRSNWAAEVVLVPRETIQRCVRFRNIRQSIPRCLGLCFVTTPY